MFEHQLMGELEVSIFSSEKYGNPCSGDSYFLGRMKENFICAIVDGLGSGIEARKSSAIAIKEIKSKYHEEDSIEVMMSSSNDALRNERGAVLAILKFDFHNKETIYSNVGNIGCTLHYPNGSVYQPIPMRGYLSGKKRNIKLEKFPIEEEMSFILHTDGLTYKGEFNKLFDKMYSTKEILQQIVHSMEQSEDDVTVLVGKLHRKRIN